MARFFVSLQGLIALYYFAGEQLFFMLEKMTLKWKKILSKWT